MTVREILHAHIPTLTDSSTVRDAVDKMDIYQFPALAIVDRNQAPIAVITEGDICRSVQEHGSLHSLRDEPAINIATPDPTSVGPDMEAGEALHLMLSRGVTILPVVDQETLLGVLLRVDLMQAMLIDSSQA